MRSDEHIDKSLRTEACPQCHESEADTAGNAVPLQSQVCQQPVVAIVEYLVERVQMLLTEISDIEHNTSVLMNRLIHEKDHSVARRLQRDIGELDARHAHVNERLCDEKKRLQTYSE